MPGEIMSKFNSARAVLAVAMAVASAASFAVTVVPVPVKLYGGGATLPADAYIGNNWLQYNPQHRLSDTQPNSLSFLNPNPATADSLFAQQAIDKKNPAYVQYCQSGSGTGRGVITGAKPDATVACGDYSTGTPSGFSAVTTRADFAASDAPLSASEVSTFVTNNGATYGSPVQFPAVAGAIAVVYHNADQVAQLNLTESQICQVFAGSITDWNQLNSALPSKPIKLVVRSDGSGTSFSFTNHLSAVCPTAQPTSVAGFSTNSTFATAAVGSVLPAGTIASSGNGGVVNSILSTDGALGYAEISDAVSREVLAGGSGLAWATVSKRPNIVAGTDPVTGAKIKAVTYKKFDPILGLPKSVAITAVSDTVLGANDANGRPTLVAQTANVPAAAACLQLVDPNTYATAPLKKDDYTQYPIMAVSYLLGYYQGNDATKLTALRNLIASPYKITGKVKTIGKGTGFAAVAIKVLDTPAQAKAGGATKKMGDLARSCLN
jgi:ABC-type phosphate transport system substrate-binding protein